ncbi:MAG: hypothetical protein RBT71_05850 [Flavobacteriales bacterium]|jgi:hypothetical protein|nr:hypothetical protein [Flavobacteriales bacterium]
MKILNDPIYGFITVPSFAPSHIPPVMPVRSLLILIILATSVPLLAQTPNLYVFGTVRHMATRDSIPFPTIHVQEADDHAVPMPVVTTVRGRYEFELTEERTYRILYKAPGKVAKSLEIDTHGPSAEQWVGGYSMRIDMTLFDSIPGADFTLLNEPVGKAHWDPITENFIWDIAYSESLRSRINEIMERYKAVQASGGAPEGTPVTEE